MRMLTSTAFSSTKSDPNEYRTNNNRGTAAYDDNGIFIVIVNRSSATIIVYRCIKRIIVDNNSWCGGY